MISLKKLDIHINFREILLILCIIFFTIIMNYVDVSPYLKDIARKDRVVQLISVFIVSLTFIVSFKSKFEVNLSNIINALIVTLLFGTLTKPKNLLEKEVENIKNEVQTIKVKHTEQSDPLKVLNKN